MELRIRFVVLVAYGMKTPYTDMNMLCRLSAPVEGGLNKYDVGRNVSLSYILLFNFDLRMSGETYPMLTEFGDGSPFFTNESRATVNSHAKSLSSLVALS